MIKEAIQHLESLFLRSSDPEFYEHSGRSYVNIGDTWKELPDGLRVPEPERLELSTLSAVATYCRERFDVNESRPYGESGLIVQVASPTVVRVMSPALGMDAVRQEWVLARALVPSLFVSSDVRMAEWLPIENLSVHLRTCFLPSEGRDTLIAFLGSWTETDAIESRDDGVSQGVVIKQGIASLAEGVAPTSVDLLPIRSFQEAEQAPSPFVLRLKKGGFAALFTADGGSWQAESTRLIAEHLATVCPEGTVILS